MPAKRDDMGGRVGDGTAPCGRAVLVGDDAQFIALLRQSQHRQQEVLAAHAVHPTGAQDQVRDACGLDGLLACQLGRAIDVDGAGWVGLNVGRALAAVEDVVGAVVDHRCAELFGFFRHHAGRFAVDAHGKVRLAFGLVHCSVGGWVDDQVGLDAADDVAHLGQVGEIHLAAVQGDDFAEALQAALQLVADLAGFSC